jgi:hypothetical protein
MIMSIGSERVETQSFLDARRGALGNRSDEDRFTRQSTESTE